MFRNNRKRIIFLIGIGSLGWSMLWAQVNVSAELAINKIMIGDQLQLQIFVEQEPGAELQGIGLDVIEKDGHIEIVRTESRDTVPTEQNLLIRQSLVLTSFDSGYHYIPPIPVVYTTAGRTDTAFTRQLALEVATIPITSDTTSLQPIKDILEEPLSLQDALPYFLGLVVLVAISGLVYYFFFRKKPKAGPVRPVVLDPAHVVARKKLQQLSQEQLWQQGQVKAFYSELTLIVREYLQRGLGIHALEETTDHILDAVKRAGLEQTLQKDLSALLVTADLVKFAKGKPAEETHSELFRKTENFVDATVALDRTVVKQPEVEVDGEHE